MSTMVDYEQMHPAEFDARVAAAPVVYQPIGCMEWHGKHLPLGLDGLKAHEICRRAARQVGGVVMPPWHLGIHPTFVMKPFHRTHNLYITRELLGSLVRESVEQFQGVGFKVVVLLTGHFPKVQGRFLRELAAELEFYKHHRIAILTPDEDIAAEAVGQKVDHAGTWETSMMMELFPDQVHMDRLDTLDGVGSELDPRESATREIGRAGSDAWVKLICEQVRARLTSN
jgi:creatinine amidohydrolase